MSAFAGIRTNSPGSLPEPAEAWSQCRWSLAARSASANWQDLVRKNMKCKTTVWKNQKFDRFQ
jgi:hypothetical protein